jgi:hypothetical protein
VRFFRQARRRATVAWLRRWRTWWSLRRRRIPRGWIWNAPFFAIGLFAVAILLIVWGLQKREVDIQRNALARDMEWTESTMRFRLQSHREFLQQVANDIADNGFDPDSFRTKTLQFIANNPELSIAWVNISESIQAIEPYDAADWLEGDVLSVEQSAVMESVRESGVPDYSNITRNNRDQPVFELYVPVLRGRAFLGTLIAVYPIDSLLSHLAPRSVTEKYHLSVVAPDGKELTAIGLRRPVDDELSYTISFDPPGKPLGLKLVVVAYRTASELVQVVPIILVIGLSLVVVGSLWVLRNHVLRRVQVEKERDRLFNLSLDMLCILDLHGHFRRANPAFEKVLGYPPDEMTGKSLLQFIHADDSAETMWQLHQLAGGVPANFENRFRCHDGRHKWLVWSINPVVEERLLYAVAHDITDRKQVEEALRAEYAFRKAMEESVVNGLRVIDLEGRIIYVNPAFCSMVGFSEQELLDTRPPFPYWPPETADISRRNLELALRGKAPPGGFETRLMRKNGERFDARMFVSPLIDASGKQTGWMSSMHDITEAKRTRAQLEASRERFLAVLEGLDAAVHVAAIDNDEILFANRGFKNVHGADAVGRNAWVVTSACQPERELITQALRDIDESASLPRELYDSEIKHATTGHWYHVRERAIRWVDGRIVRMQIATDITDRKNVDEERRQQSLRLQQTSRLITMGEMASSLAHELNQPLAAIANYSSGCVQRLESGRYDNAELLGAMRKAASQAERAGKIIRRVREFVRKSEPNCTAVPLAEIVDDVVGFADIEARKASVKLRADVEPGMPPVYADGIMIEQVLLNLIKNGIEAMSQTPHARRVLRVDARSNGQGMAELAVADRGHGVSDDDKEKMFEPFYTTKHEGMGMGLNICRTIIEFHNGRLWVESNPHGGSIFHFTLPFDRALGARQQRAPR